MQCNNSCCCSPVSSPKGLKGEGGGVSVEEGGTWSMPLLVNCPLTVGYFDSREK